MRSQLRQDLVSGDWIVVAPGRGKRPHQFVKNPEKRKIPSKATCPFENPQKSGHGKPILLYPHTKRGLVPAAQNKNNPRYDAGVYGSEKDWQLQIVDNKYPAFTHKDNKCASFFREGPYLVTQTVGHHELVITRNHHRNFSMLSADEANQVFEAFRDRYLMLLNDKCLSYISIFHNWGLKAGASIYHPHYQIIAIPVIPPDVEHSLAGSLNFGKKNKKCVHCVMISQEKKDKRRILYENKGVIAFTPFVSKEPFEVRIFLKKHSPYFENTLDYDLMNIVKALQYVLKKFDKNLKYPDYNFFIHTAPLKNKSKYSHYHWHIEIRPKIGIMAGFEKGTGIDINAVDPDEAVILLRK